MYESLDCFLSPIWPLKLNQFYAGCWKFIWLAFNQASENAFEYPFNETFLKFDFALQIYYPFPYNCL